MFEGANPSNGESWLADTELITRLKSWDLEQSEKTPLKG